MCKRGSWRGFHTRYLKTPGNAESPLVVMEQCTECGSYRARDMENMPYVEPQEEDGERQDDAGVDLTDPESEDGGSVWGPDSTQSSSDDGW